MSEFMKRTIFGLLYTIVVISAVLLHPYALLALLVVIYVGGLTEMKHLLKATASSPLFMSASFAGTFLLWAHLQFLMNFHDNLTALLGMVLIAILVHHTFIKNSETENRDLQNVLTGLVYLLIPTSLSLSIVYINGFSQPVILLFVFIFLWVNDTFAYLTGKAFGKTKLLERLSPKKSVEGFIGGLAGTILTGYGISFYNQDIEPIHWMVISALISISGTIGDLFQSSLKRVAGVKDSGNIIPGHGGILDRLDSFLFAVPVVYFYLRFFLN
jgi:phosphatidate cytidylyltransferase